MQLNKDFKNCVITVAQLISFSQDCFSMFSPHDFAVVDSGEVAEKIAYSEEKNELGNSYYTAVNLRGTFKLDDTELTVTGVLKGVNRGPDGFVIDCVKSLRYPLSVINEQMYTPWLAESKCLAYLLSNARSLEAVSIRLIFVHTETLEKKKITLKFSKSDLQNYFSSLLYEYLRWNKLYADHIDKRSQTLSRTHFPFESMRDGQETIMREVYSAISDKRPLYVNAPTGIGKTSAILYPALKSLAEDKAERIFYLTSKNALHSVVIDTCKKMTEAKIRILSLVSKNKVCPGGKCDKLNCSRASGHTSRLKEALYSLVSSEYIITPDVLKSYGDRYNVCPFELARHTAQFSDIVICDYNYIFDPYVSRVSFFTSKKHDVLLVDEAHNLVERVKEMYSATLSLPRLEKLTSYLKDENGEKLIRVIKTAIENDIYTAEPLDKTTVEELVISSCQYLGFLQELVRSRDFSSRFDENSPVTKNNVLIFFRDLKRFIELSDKFNDSYIAYFEADGSLKIALTDTGKTIKNVFKKLGGAVFFSATLAPEEYYRHMLGSSNKDTYLNLTSPFSKENFKVISYNLSTRYSERAATLSEVIEVIYAAVTSNKGNYMVFLPSYSYLASVADAFSKRYPEIKILAEKSGMNSHDKTSFLDAFNSHTGLVAFAVMGGNFSEGVDLAGDKLSGAVIIGLGVLPPERSRELTASYFNDRFFDGAKFAYMYPGMNKVFQAGGRVIRGESDRGFLVVVDDRFLTEDYLEHLPDFWQNIARAKTAQKVSEILCEFWLKT